MSGKLAVLILLTALAIPLAAQNVDRVGLPMNGQQTAAFPSGGEVEIHVPVGDVTVRRSATSQLRLRYRLNPPDHGSDKGWADQVRLRFEVHGSRALIEFENERHGDHGSVDAEIDAPPTTDIRVKVGVGDISLSGISGSKDLSTGVGDIKAEIGDRSEYSTIKLSTGVGDVDAPWGHGEGFVGKTLSVSDKGRYRLYAHTGVGDVRFRS